ncbi:hypothetical protein [Henriciella sp.]|uniref:hypothetical protein n=1 Tax=Henriciella sp. TaxID=1968823 RepID=UPI0026214AA1|nr:hypothetical protein [Henriciella sp.]
MHIAIVSMKARHKRHPRSRQRALADIAEEQASQAACLVGQQVRLSRTHSRGVSGAAISTTATCLGLDIEFEDEQRDWPGILGLFSPRLRKMPALMPDLVRTWTFLEAYYKAVGRYPEAGYVEAVAEPVTPSGSVLPLGGNMFLYHKVLTGGAHLSVVWCGEGRAPVILPEQVLDSVD